MIHVSKLIVLVSFISAPLFAEQWSGMLVNSTCYDTEERNTTLKAEEVNHDRNFEIVQCAPSLRTKSFAVVQRDGQMLRLDSAGNDKAADLIRKVGRATRVHVAVTGSKTGSTIRVESVELAP
jgi:hypothetical protein